MWILYVLIYSFCKGIREIFKKMAFQKNTVMEVLFFYVILSFVFVIPEAKDAFSIADPMYLLPILGKSFVIFIAWLTGFYAMSKMPISLYGVLDLSRVLFSTGYGVVLLSEQMSKLQIIGLILVCAGLMMLRFNPKSKKTDSPKEKIQPKYIILAFVGCAFTAFSGFLDKKLMATGDITSGQLQFWYCLFLVGFYLVYILATRTKFNLKSVAKNYWVYLMSLSLVVGDKLLFIANTYPDCRVTVMTLIKQSSCIVIILGGKFIFKEKKILYKILCACVVIAGILVALV